MERFYETDKSIVFPKLQFCFHKSFVKTFKGKTIIQARRVLKMYYTRSQQDEIIHYLKIKNIIR